jgi:hypothetical protein
MMRVSEWRDVFQIANSEEDLSGENTDHLVGFGLPDFEPTNVTKRQLARIVRHQAKQMNGQWDMEALNEITRNRRKFIIV